MNAEAIKYSVASYFRYVRQCPVIAFEANWQASDILVLSNSRRLIEIEVKVTLSDFKRDRQKRKHHRMANLNRNDFVSQFYFAVPKEIANKCSLLCDELYPYAGVIGSDGSGDLGVSIYRQARILTADKVPISAIVKLVKDQSGTLCRLAGRIIELQLLVKENNG